MFDILQEMKNISTLVFDYDGVITIDEYRGLKVFCPNEDLVEKVEEKYYDKSEDSGLWDDLRQSFSLTISDAELKEALNYEDKEQEEYRKIFLAETEQYREKYELVLVSNQITSRAKYLKKRGDVGMFDHVFFSNEISLKKPDIKIFEYLLDTVSGKAHNCLFIDDAPENIQAAASLGFNTYLFNSLDRLSLEQVLTSFC